MSMNLSFLKNGEHFLVFGAIVAVLLSGCGGGGGGGSDEGDTPPVRLSLNGVAAKGLPLASKTVSIKDKNGASTSATTATDGSYSADITGMTAPFLIKVDDLYSVSVASVSATANVHPLTDMIIRNWYKVQGSSVDTAFTTNGAMPTPPTDTAIAMIEGVVRQILATYLRGANVNPSNFNVITSTFTADHSGFDLVLDNLTVTQPATSGGNVTIGLTGGGSAGTILTVSESTSLTTITPPPAPISDITAPSSAGTITATRISPTQVVLSWVAATDNIQMGGYKIYRSGTQVGITDQPFYIDGAAPATSACYTVAAYDVAGNSSAQNSQLCALDTSGTADVTAPTAPANLTAVASSSSQINLTWTASTDNVAVAGYRVMVSGAAIATLAATDTSYSHTGLSASTLYSYTVVAIDTSGNATSSSGASATTSAKTDNTAPTAPSSLTATVVSSTRIDLAWSASTDAVGVAGYKVYLSSTLIGTSATAAFSHINLTANTQYCYTVSAVDAAGNVSTASAQVCATTSSGAIVGTWTNGLDTSFSFDANGNFIHSQTTTRGEGGSSVVTLQVWPGFERGTYTWNATTGALVFTCPTIDTNGSAGTSGSPPNGYAGFGGLPIGAACDTPTTTITATVSGSVLTLSDVDFSMALTQVGKGSGMTVFTLPTGTLATFIATGPDGNFWFTDSAANTIGKMTPTGVVTLYPIPTANSEPQTIINGPDGNDGTLWFVESAGNKIAKITTAGVITEYANTAGGWVNDLAVGPDGNIWFTDQGVLGGGDSMVNANGAIGKIDIATGAVTKYPLLSAATQANWITRGPDGAMWFTQAGGSNNTARITTAGVITEFTATEGTALAQGPDGNLWMTTTNAVARLTTAGVMTPYTVPTTTNIPLFIVPAPDGNLWFSAPGGTLGNWTSAGVLGRITTSGVITEYPLPAFTNLDPELPTIGALTIGFDGALWFTFPRSGKIVLYYP